MFSPLFWSTVMPMEKNHRGAGKGGWDGDVVFVAIESMSSRCLFQNGNTIALSCHSQPMDMKYDTLFWRDHKTSCTSYSQWRPFILGEQEIIILPGHNCLLSSRTNEAKMNRFKLRIYDSTGDHVQHTEPNLICHDLHCAKQHCISCTPAIQLWRRRFPKWRSLCSRLMSNGFSCWIGGVGGRFS